MANSVFYNYDDSSVDDADFLIGGINYLLGADRIMQPDDSIFNAMMENYSSDIIIKTDSEYSKLNIVADTQ